MQELSQREAQVAAMYREGKRASEIADALGLSANTIGIYKRQIHQKLGVRNTAEMIRELAKKEKQST